MAVAFKPALEIAEICADQNHPPPNAERAKGPLHFAVEKGRTDAAAHVADLQREKGGRIALSQPSQ
jgi:hypothetical protein